MSFPDQPIRFIPTFRSYIWGGERLATRLGKKPPGSGIWAESWEIVDHREAESIVAVGPFEGWTIRQLIESFPHEILGEDKPQERFPLLLKYLDCERVLSVQVHPDDEYGATMTVPDRGKTESWYVIDAAPEAVLYAGLKQGVDRTTLADAIEAGKTEDCLHVLYPKSGDCIFIPAGTVHALGAGLMVAEIQQASDCTFRLYDWNRVDKDGQPRPLHIAQALEVIDFDRGPIDFVKRNGTGDGNSTTLVDCDKFRLTEIRGPMTATLGGDRFSIVTVPSGNARLETSEGIVELSVGETVLVPSACRTVKLVASPGSTVLVSTLPQ